MNTLLPETSDGIDMDALSVIAPSKTYKINYDTNSRAIGYRTGIDAMKQAIYKIINTERYQYIIYSWNYGIELDDLFGQPIPYVYAELQRRIEEALRADERIKQVYDFTFSNDKRGNVLCKFKADTLYGTVEAEKEVNTGV